MHRSRQITTPAPHHTVFLQAGCPSCWLGGRKGIRPVKNWVVGCWRGYLSAARCRLARLVRHVTDWLWPSANVWVWLPHLGLLVVEVLPDGHQQLTQAFKAVLITRTQQLEQTVMHDGLSQHPQLVQLTNEPAPAVPIRRHSIHCIPCHSACHYRLIAGVLTITSMTKLTHTHTHTHLTALFPGLPR